MNSQRRLFLFKWKSRHIISDVSCSQKKWCYIFAHNSSFSHSGDYCKWHWNYLLVVLFCQEETLLIETHPIAIVTFLIIALQKATKGSWLCPRERERKWIPEAVRLVENPQREAFGGQEYWVSELFAVAALSSTATLQDSGGGPLEEDMKQSAHTPSLLRPWIESGPAWPPATIRSQRWAFSLGISH